MFLQKKPVIYLHTPLQIQYLYFVTFNIKIAFLVYADIHRVTSLLAYFILLKSN